MEALIRTLLTDLRQAGGSQTVEGLLTNAGKTITSHCQADLVVGYRLIPETGGMPRTPAIFHGDLNGGQSSVAILEETPSVGLVRSLIHNWEPRYVGPDDLQPTLTVSSTSEVGYARFIKAEGIKALYFIPIEYDDARLGVLILNFRNIPSLDARQMGMLEVCGTLVGPWLADLYRYKDFHHAEAGKRVVPHTLYGNFANIFRHDIDTLEDEVTKMMGGRLPRELRERFDSARHVVFDVMRNLVIETGGDLLVDVRTTPLELALTTTASALKRAWPRRQRIAIDIHPIPDAVDRAPTRFREVLYTLILEAMGNAVKHGGPPDYIAVEVKWRGDQVHVQVSDHGVGFDPKTTTMSERGLGFWKQYVEDYLLGKFNIASDPLNGTTTIEATIPIISPTITL